MFKSKRELPAYKMPAVEECALWGARELRYEELLAVNGGKRKEADREKVFSEETASSGGSSLADMLEKQQSLVNAEYIKQEMRKEEAGSGNAALSESASADSNASSDSGTSVSDSSSESFAGNLNSSGAESGEKKHSGGSTDYTVQRGDTLSGIVRKQYPEASKEEIVRRVKEAAANSGITDIDKIEPGQKIVFEKPVQDSSGGEPVKQNKQEGKASGCDGTAGGGTAQEERKSSSGSGSLWGGERESGYRQETGRCAGGGQFLSEQKAQTGMRQEYAGQGTQDVRSKISGFFDRLWNKFGNVNKTNAESYLGKSRGGNWQGTEKFPVPSVQGSNPASEGYVPPAQQEKENTVRPSTGDIRTEANKYTHHSYVIGENEFRCDNYVEAVIRDSGLNPLDFLAGPATKKNVEQHIAHAQEKGFAVKSERYKPQNLEDGAYVVLMNNSDKNFNAHAGMIFQEGGNTEYRDNSSCNTWKNEDGIQIKGGVIQQNYSDLGEFQADYGYNDFYYIRIN